jgi:hypothetical protein
MVNQNANSTGGNGRGFDRGYSTGSDWDRGYRSDYLRSDYLYAAPDPWWRPRSWWGRDWGRDWGWGWGSGYRGDYYYTDCPDGTRTSGQCYSTPPPPSRQQQQKPALGAYDIGFRVGVLGVLLACLCMLIVLVLRARK